MSELTIDHQTWKKVASGELGDSVDWEPGFEALGNVYWMLCRLGEMDADRIDWDELIGDNHYFDSLRDTWPPFGNESDFEQYLSGFLAVTTEPDGSEMPGHSFIWVDLYVDTTAKDKVVNAFESFEQHLRSIPIVREAID